MLPRHLRSLALSQRTSSVPNYLAVSQRNGLYPPPFRISSVASQGRLAASFHTSSSRRNEVPKSPFQTFVDVLKDELRKNRELQDNVKQLQGDVDKLQDSETMKKARAAYERARVRDLMMLQCIAENVLNFHAVNFFYQRKSASYCSGS